MRTAASASELASAGQFLLQQQIDSGPLPLRAVVVYFLGLDEVARERLAWEATERT